MYSQMPISKDLPSCNTTLLFATFQNGTEAGEQCMTNLIVERSFISFHHIYNATSRHCSGMAVRFSLSQAKLVRTFPSNLHSASLRCDRTIAACSIKL